MEQLLRNKVDYWRRKAAQSRRDHLDAVEGSLELAEFVLSEFGRRMARSDKDGLIASIAKYRQRLKLGDSYPDQPADER